MARGRSDVFQCQFKEHEGDRVIRFAREQVLVSLDFMADENRKRLFRIDVGAMGLPSRICSTCARKWERRYRGMPGQEALL